MANLIKQTRSRFTGTGQDNKEERSNMTDRKTQSFREKKRSQSWISRQFSRQLSWDYDFSGSDYPTAIAAAAYAIQSLEETQTRDKKGTTDGPDKSLNKTKSHVEDNLPLKSALKSSDGTSKNNRDNKLPINTSMTKKAPEKQPSMKKKISFADMDEIANKGPEKLAAEKGPERAPMRSPPPFSDKELNITEIKKPDITVPKPETRKQSSTIPVPVDPRADAWEKEEMASLRKRYEKLRATVEDWETKKKKKAKRKIEKIEAELDKRRAKAVQSYHIKIARIERIAGGAKVQAEENRRNEEAKVKEKANKIRTTGMLPATCLCF